MMLFSAGFTAEQLFEWLLENKVDSAAAQKLREENLDGETFPEMSEGDLKELSLPLGTRIKIFSLVKSVKATITEVVVDVIEPQDFAAALGRTISPTPGPSRSPVPPVSLGFTVRSSLESQTEGKALIKLLDKSATLELRERKLFVKIVVQELVKQTGHSYPTPGDKVKLAKQIVAEFPSLKATPRPGLEGYEHFYCPKSYSGFIESRLKTLHRALTPSKKRFTRKKTAPSSSGADTSAENTPGSATVSEELQEKVTWMRRTNPTTVNKTKIAEALSDTFTLRRGSIAADKLSVTAILDQYPRLVDFDGDMIEQEYGLLHPKNPDMIGRFVNFYKPRIAERARLKGLKMPEVFGEIVNDDLEAMIHLATMLPAVNLRKRNLMEDKHSNCLVTFVLPGVDLQEYALAKKAQFSQPHLICAGTPEELGPFFVILDHRLLAVGPSPLQAIDLLMKCHYVFDVKYCRSLENFFNFLEVFLFKTPDVRAFSKVVEIESMLSKVF